MKEHRLAEIVRMLRGNAQVTASILADRLQVSRRTILRDLQELQRRGVPIRTECGANGGVSILPGWLPPMEQLTDSELLAFMIPGGEYVAQELGLAQHFRRAQHKIDARLNPTQSRKVGLLQDRLLIVPTGWREPLDTPPVLRELLLAIAADYIVDVDYSPGKGRAAVRRCEPLGLIFAGTHWYVLVRKVPDGEIRTYRADRMSSVTRTNQRFTRDPSESVADLWRSARRTYKKGGSIPITVRATSPVRNDVAFCLRLLGSEPTEEPIEGSSDVLIHGNTKALSPAVGVLSGFGCAAEVLEPVELRERILEVGEENVRLYSAAPTMGSHDNQ